MTQLLTAQHVRRLLAAAAAYDNRNLNESTAVAWQQAAEVARWTYDEAQQAIVEHYAESTDFIQPGHITQRIRAKRHDRQSRQRELEAAQPSDQATIDRIMAGIGKSMGWYRDEPQDEHTQHRAALSRPCPYCRAQAGQPCTRAGRDGRREALSSLHPKRYNTRVSRH